MGTEGSTNGDVSVCECYKLRKFRRFVIIIYFRSIAAVLVRFYDWSRKGTVRESLGTGSRAVVMNRLFQNELS